MASRNETMSMISSSMIKSRCLDQPCALRLYNVPVSFLWIVRVSRVSCFFVFFFQVAVEVGVDGVTVGAEQEGHFTVGCAGDVGGFIGFLGQVEVFLGLAAPEEVAELLKDFVDGPDLLQAHGLAGLSVGLGPDDTGIAFQHVGEDADMVLLGFLFVEEPLVFRFLQRRLPLIQLALLDFDQLFHLGQALFLFPDGLFPLLQRFFCDAIRGLFLRG